jgi:hypothetical protein
MQVHEVNDRAVASAVDAPASPTLPVRAFLSGRAEDLVPDLLAFALYARDREARGPVGAPSQGEDDPVLRFRREATADLTNFTYRFFHNQIEEIRIAAVREQLGNLPRPPGFLTLVAASAVAVMGVGAAVLWAMGHGSVLVEMAGRVAQVVQAIGH